MIATKIVCDIILNLLAYYSRIILNSFINASIINQGLLQVNIDYCEGVTCNNSGECIDQIDGFACKCDLEFTGEFCQHNIDDCEDVNCNNGGCLDEVNGFTCQCIPGFFGDTCENTDHCFGITCSGNGECENLQDTFTCTCETGYTGDQCQVESEYYYITVQLPIFKVYRQLHHCLQLSHYI